MKKEHLLWMAAALMLAACNPRAGNRISLTGTVERDIDSLSISVMRNDNSDTLIAKVPVVDGQYAWKGTADSACIIRVYYGQGSRDFYRFIGEPGDIVLNIPLEGEGFPSGTPLNDSIHAYQSNVARLNAKANDLGAEVRAAQTDEERDSLYEEQRKVWHEGNFYRADVLNRHTDDIFGIYLLRDFQLYNYPERIEEATRKLKENFPDNFWAKMVGDRNEGLMRGFPGRKYTDLRMATPEGGELSLSDVVPSNRYTYVDFWASWCGPCVADIPHVKAAYEKYHKMGLEIVGVSFDNDEGNWKEALKKYGMAWLQMSDLKGWGCAAAKVYGINAIPSTLLIGQDGIIVARDLRGQELAQKMAELLERK